MLAGDPVAAGQLSAAQLALAHQAKALTVARQELSKLQIKFRIKSRDLRTSLRQVVTCACVYIGEATQANALGPLLLRTYAIVCMQ